MWEIFFFTSGQMPGPEQCNSLLIISTRTVCKLCVCVCVESQLATDHANGCTTHSYQPTEQQLTHVIHASVEDCDRISCCQQQFLLFGVHTPTFRNSPLFPDIRSVEF